MLGVIYGRTGLEPQTGARNRTTGPLPHILNFYKDKVSVVAKQNKEKHHTPRSTLVYLNDFTCLMKRTASHYIVLLPFLFTNLQAYVLVRSHGS